MPVDTLPGSANVSEDHSTRDLLLQLISELSGLMVLLHETDDEEFPRLQPRILYVKALADALPMKPSVARTVVGFKQPQKRKGKK